MPDVLKGILTAALTFGVLDVIWLGFLMASFYRNQLAGIARLEDGHVSPMWTPALLVYALLSLGIVVFVVPRADTAGEALAFGALFGLIAFGVYDLTNYATLTAWPLVVTVVDLAWGAVACGTAAVVTFTVVR